MQALWDEIQAGRRNGAAPQVSSVNAKIPKPDLFHGSTKPDECVDN